MIVDVFDEGACCVDELLDVVFTDVERMAFFVFATAVHDVANHDGLVELSEVREGDLERSLIKRVDLGCCARRVRAGSS